MTYRIIIAALLVSFFAADAQGQNRYRRRGVIFGGLAGAAIGAAIGDKGDNETAGALIGGAVGAIAGGKIGSDKDRRIQHNHRYHSGYYSGGQYSGGQYSGGQYYGGQPYPTPQPYGHYDHHGYHHTAPAYPTYRQPVVVGAQPITTADVIEMRRRGLGETTMIRLIETHGVAIKPSVSEVIDMHEQGVSERVIAAMQGDLIHGQSNIGSAEDYIPSVGDAPPVQYPAAGDEYLGPSIVAPSNGQ